MKCSYWRSAFCKLKAVRPGQGFFDTRSINKIRCRKHRQLFRTDIIENILVDELTHTFVVCQKSMCVNLWNVIKSCRSHTSINTKLLQAARTYNFDRLNDHMKAVKSINENSFLYLTNSNPELWTNYLVVGPPFISLQAINRSFLTHESARSIVRVQFCKVRNTSFRNLRKNCSSDKFANKVHITPAPLCHFLEKS